MRDPLPREATDDEKAVIEEALMRVAGRAMAIEAALPPPTPLEDTLRRVYLDGGPACARYVYTGKAES